MPLRRGVTALAKLKMLRKKYPCDWPGKRDGTHAPAASAWLVGPREPESSLWVCQPEPCRRKAVCTLGMHAGGLEFGPLSPLIAP